MAQPSRNVRLTGTDEAPSEGRVLRVGPVTAELENGALRHIAYNGTEVLRGVAFLARNVNWGTYAPALSDLQVSQDGGGFKVTYRATCRDDMRSTAVRTRRSKPPPSTVPRTIASNPPSSGK